MTEPEILTDGQQMLSRALAAKDAEIEQWRALFHQRRANAEEVQIASNAYIAELRAENERLRDGLKDALAAIDWMVAAKQPLFDPWFTHRDALIARARDALGRSNG